MGNSDYREIMVTGAESLKTRYNEKVGLIRSWDFGNWQYPVIIDNMMNLEYLLWAAKKSEGKSLFQITWMHRQEH